MEESQELDDQTVAASLIQKVYRNYRRQQQAELFLRNDAAEIIQSSYRIYATKKFCFKIARDFLLCGDLLQRWFDVAATKIQATFRGYNIRKQVFDYYKFKEWLKFVGKRLFSM